jgi:hypothetical protein
MAPRRRTYARAARGQRGTQMMQLGIAFVSGGLGFVIADGLDRLLATYDPAETDVAKRPKDKFTSDGSGTLANTLNVASAPGLLRIAVGLGAAAVPAVGAAYVVNPFLRSSLEGAAIGAGVNLFKTLWNNLLMPALRPKDTSAASLQKSYIARLYPAEVAAAINREQKKTAAGTGEPNLNVAPGGVLSGANGGQAGVGAQADVGPFALAAESPYADAAQALRREAGMQGPGGDYQTAAQAMGTGGDYPTQQNVWGTGAQATGTGAPATGVAAWSPGPPPGTGPGPQGTQPHAATPPECACLGDDNPFLGFIGDEDKDTPFLTMQ